MVWALLHYLPDILALPETRTLALNATMMKIHGAAAMASLILVGSLITEHIPGGWRRERNKVSGVSTLALFCILAVSGYVLYYAGSEIFRTVASYIHLGTGIALLVPVITHVAGKKEKGPAGRGLPEDLC